MDIWPDWDESPRFPRCTLYGGNTKDKTHVIVNFAIITEPRSVQYVKWYMKILSIIVLYKNCISSEVWPPNHELVQRVKRRTPRFADVSNSGLLWDQSRFMSLWCPSHFHPIMTVSFFSWHDNHITIFKDTMITKITTRKPYGACSILGTKYFRSERILGTVSYVANAECHHLHTPNFNFCAVTIWQSWYKLSLQNFVFQRSPPEQ